MYRLFLCYVAPEDYQTVERQLTFTSGMRRIPISIPIQSDQIDEENETFRTVLDQEPRLDAVSLMPGVATVTITDDDGKIFFTYYCYLFI